MVITDTSPTNNDFTLNCVSFPNPEAGVYNISVTVVLNDVFTPAVVEAIQAFQVSRLLVDSNGNEIIRDGSISINLPPITDIFNQTRTFDPAMPQLGRGNQYQYAVSESEA